MENKRQTILKTTWYQKWKDFYNEGLDSIDQSLIVESKSEDVTSKKLRDKKIDKDLQSFEKFLKLELKKLKTKLKNDR